MEALKNKFFSLKNFVLDLFFPTKCIKCHTKGPELCKKCSDTMKYPDQENMTDIFACFEYHNPHIKKLLHFLKYYRKQHIGEILGRYVYERLIEEIAELQTFSAGNKILLIPAPLSFHRLRERGYNQATIIARGMIEADMDGILALETTIVSKTKDTLPQARIKDRLTRLKNIKNCFAINNSIKIRGKTIIVIDDITTTGGTLNEIITLLKESGAKKVVGFAVAH